MKELLLSKRETCLGLLGLGILASLPVGQFSKHPIDCATTMLHKLLPGYRFESTGLKQFSRDFERETHSAHGPYLEKVARYKALVGMGMSPDAMMDGEWVDRFERSWLTKFITESNFFSTQPGEEVVYHGYRRSKPCPNPFIRIVEMPV